MILNSNHNYNKANFNFFQNNMANNNNVNKSINFGVPLVPNYINHHHNNNFINQTRLFKDNFAINQYMLKQQINPIHQTFNNYKNNSQYKNFHNQQKKIEIECICGNNKIRSINEVKQCILCKKYQHISCIHQAKELTPYICFNCQFENNHFYLKWIRAILPAKEFIYKKRWEDDPSLLQEGTKNFEFNLNLKEIYDTYNINPNNNNENNSYYLAFLCLTNNGKPFHLGFPDNINISINEKKFYNTASKGFKRPLLLALENNKYYIPKKKHLITLDRYEIPNAAAFFSDKNINQKVTISFSNNLENYRGSEFEFVDVRHYLIYIGIFQEIKIPQMSLLRECKNLEEYNQIFKNFYEEKVKRFNWKDVANFVSMGNEQLNMNLISEISNQKIIRPVRGLFCQHTEVMDYGECCGYITSNNQVYKCFKCNKPLNIMYIDDMSEKIFNTFIKKNFSQIYYTNDFNFIRGEKIEENNTKGKEHKNNDKQSEIEEDESLSESFFKFHENRINNGEFIDDNYENYQEQIENEVIELNSDTESMLIEPNSNELQSNIVSDNRNIEIENRNEKSNLNKYVNDSDANNNLNIQINDLTKNNLDKSNDQTHIDNNIRNYTLNDNNEKNKNNEEIITLIEDDDDDNNSYKENQDNYNNYSTVNNNRSINIENDKENMSDNSSLNQQNQINKNINNLISENNENKKNDKKIENSKAINHQKNKQDALNISKKSESVDDRTNVFLEKKRNKLINKKKKKEIENEKENIGNEVYSPRKRIKLRRIEPSPSLKNKKKNNIKERKLRKKAKDKNENIKQKIDKEINNLSNINNNINEIMSSEQSNNNYINASRINNNVNSNEKVKKKNERDEKANNHINNKSKNKSEIKNRRRNSDLSSSSNSHNTKKTNVGYSEYNSKDNEKDKRRKKKLINEEKGKLKEKLFNNLSYNNKEKEKENSKKNSDLNFDSTDYFHINDKLEEIQINNSEENDNDDEEYETIMIDRKDLIEIKPYNNYQEKNRIVEDEDKVEFLNDFDIFENGLLNNNQMEFINYDYYNIQRRLREYCSKRYQDDEIFNGNKTFFNKFK